jgi:OOP family OmpA-OmpF porin
MYLLALGALLFALSAPTLAQERSNAPTVEQMVQSLTPQPKTRSFSAGGQEGRTRNLIPVLDLTVNFDFDSARLREDSKALLQDLAAALLDPRLSEYRFRVEGHTDAKGTAAYNDQLSERRAQAVVSFLSSTGVASERLEPLGKGFRELLNPADPNAPLNRRVRVLTLR